MYGNKKKENIRKFLLAFSFFLTFSLILFFVLAIGTEDIDTGACILSDTKNDACDAGNANINTTATEGARISKGDNARFYTWNDTNTSSIEYHIEDVEFHFRHGADSGVTGKWVIDFMEDDAGSTYCTDDTQDHAVGDNYYVVNTTGSCDWTVAKLDDFSIKFTSGDGGGSTDVFVYYADMFIYVKDDIWYSSVSDNSSADNFEGSSINHSVIFGDDINTELSHYIFSTNMTGTWTNKSYTFTNSWSETAENVTSLSGCGGTTVAWKFYANDTNNNWNTSSEETYSCDKYGHYEIEFYSYGTHWSVIDDEGDGGVDVAQALIGDHSSNNYFKNSSIKINPQKNIIVDRFDFRVNSVSNSDYISSMNVYICEENSSSCNWGSLECTLVNNSFDPLWQPGWQTVTLSSPYTMEKNNIYTILFDTPNSNNDGLADALNIGMDNSASETGVTVYLTTCTQYSYYANVKLYGEHSEISPTFCTESNPCNWAQYSEKTANVTVTCRGGTCGETSIAVRYNNSGTNMFPVNTTEGGSPLFVSGGTNATICSEMYGNTTHNCASAGLNDASMGCDGAMSSVFAYVREVEVNQSTFNTGDTINVTCNFTQAGNINATRYIWYYDDSNWFTLFQEAEYLTTGAHYTKSVLLKLNSSKGTIRCSVIGVVGPNPINPVTDYCADAEETRHDNDDLNISYNIGGNKAFNPISIGTLDSGESYIWNVTLNYTEADSRRRIDFNVSSTSYPSDITSNDTDDAFVSNVSAPAIEYSCDYNPPDWELDCGWSCTNQSINVTGALRIYSSGSSGTMNLSHINVTTYFEINATNPCTITGFETWRFLGG